ncbi:MAG: hypothetical protein GYB25_11805 [Rhodobacteraceae bacterium]|nr:hypothetical protein [Paracoccaceae bacterium]
MNYTRALGILALALALPACGDIIDDIFGKKINKRPPVAPPSTPVALDCKVECKLGSETGNCVFINAVVSRPEYRDRITNLQALITTHLGQGRISHATMMNLFDNPDDPCDRGDLDLSPDGVFANGSTSNDACYLQYESNLIGTVTLGVPDYFSGRYVGGAQTGVFDLKFENEAQAFEVIFGDAALNQSIGGKLLEINILPNRALFRTQTACLASAI